MTSSSKCAALIFIEVLYWSSLAHSQGYPPTEAANRMSVAEGFRVELVAAEPHVRQPVAIDFDDRGRLWVLQYLQYPNPAGLKRVHVDRYSRTTYDRVPEPPPLGPQGADRLTILKDTDGDGRSDTSQDFVKGLNLATGFAFGNGGVFVLQTPYLLFYPDRNRDDIPDGDPEVLLQGFGMEDTSSLANSLIWGPDGWLYGAQGTNLTANIRGIEFEQGVWRYHPRSKEFELFAEGGANMWGLDFDRSGRLLAGTNYGGYLMLHLMQGAYYQKSFAKHGDLHNPFAFGYFGHVPHENFQGGHVTVGGVIYQSDSLPQEYRDKYIAVDTLGHAVRWHHITPDKSTVRSANGGVLLEANDTWFAPSDATIGPDGAIYIADWHDKRTAHPDPDATWDRSNGRVYRLQWGDLPTSVTVDFSKRSSEELIRLLTDSNEWNVRRARRILAERRSPADIAQIRKLAHSQEDGHRTLQYLWTLAAQGAIEEGLETNLLEHENPDVRSWTIRLLGDSKRPTTQTVEKFLSLAQSESNPNVISQLASTAKRLPAEHGLLIAHTIAQRDEFQNDPRIPLLLWWAIEHHVEADAALILEHFVIDESWRSSLIREDILGRLMRRFAGGGRLEDFTAAARCVHTAPNAAAQRMMLEELDAGLKMLNREKRSGLPLGNSFTKIAIQRLDRAAASKRFDAVPAPFEPLLSKIWNDDCTDPLILRLATRLGNPAAYARTCELARNRVAPEAIRQESLKILLELGDSRECVELGISLVSKDESETIQLMALDLLARFDDERIYSELVKCYENMSATLQAASRRVLLGRAESARRFLERIDQGLVPAESLSADELRRVALHESPEVDALVRKHWGTIRAGTAEDKLAEIRRISNDLRAGSGDPEAGKKIFSQSCATCHQLFGEGNRIGPDLTKANRHDREFLLSSIVDPSTQIRKEYLNYIIAMNDGRILTGIITAQSSTGFAVLDAKNQRVEVATDDVAEVKVSPVSLMPENILKALKPQQVRDLFSHLERHDAGNGGLPQ